MAAKAKWEVAAAGESQESRQDVDEWEEEEIWEREGGGSG